MTKAHIAPITTHYKGYRFRSRLEARWAVFFDSVSWTYKYEPEGYILTNDDWYLPDFWLTTYMRDREEQKNWGYWLEIKAGKASADELLKLTLLAVHTNHNALMVQGDPYPGEYSIIKVQHMHTQPVKLIQNMKFDLFPDGSGPYLTERQRKTMYSGDLLNDAYNKARGIRFEHTEKS